MSIKGVAQCLSPRDLNINKLRFTAQIQHDKEEIDNMAHLSNGHVDTSGMDRKVRTQTMSW